MRPTSLSKALPRVAIGALLFIALLVAIPVLTLAFGRVTVTRLAHGDPSLDGPRAGSGQPSRRRGPGLCEPHVRLAWRLRRPYLARRETAGADHYTRYEVIGWYARSGRSAVSVTDTRTPDTEWYGSAPRLAA